MKKNQIITIALVIWAVFAVGYIINDQIGDFKTYYLQKVSQDSYNKGQGDAVLKVIEESKKCKPFSVYVGSNKVSLIGTDCLNKNNVHNNTNNAVNNNNINSNQNR